MKECCEPSEGQACSPVAEEPGVCPCCGKKGKPVTTLTVKSLVRDHTRVSASASYSFCRTLECDVVYFASQVIFHKPDLKVRVGIKETASPILLCYCFDYSREDICHRVGAGEATVIQEKVRAEVQGGFCACEVKNPSGACCLGDIARAIQQCRKDISTSDR